MTSEHETLLRQRGYCSDCLSDSDWSESSLSSSCSSSSLEDSYFHSSSHHEWKDEVMPNGQVFHIRSEKLNLKTDPDDTFHQANSNQRNGREKSTTEKLVRLIRRRNSRRTRKKHVSDIIKDREKAAATSTENSKDYKTTSLAAESLDANKVDDSLSNFPYGVMYFRVNDISETDTGDQGLVYCYPRPINENLVYSIKGALVMLYQLLSDITVSPLTSSSVIVKNHLCHVVFTPQNFELMVLTVPDVRCSRLEAIAFNADVTRFLQFSYQTLSRCFSSPQNHEPLDQLFSAVFLRLLSNSSVLTSTPEEKLLSALQSCSFEQFTPAAHRLTLPRDAQVQIDDALSELESNDFSEISDAHFGCQRLYTIVGTCLFYKSYLLATHLNQQDLVDVVSFCRHQNLLRLAHDEVIKSMVVWREVYLSSCDRGLSRFTNNNSSYKLPQGRWFLLIVGSGHGMLAVLLESGGCTIKAPEAPSPDPFYVKQSVETLEHIIKIGVMSLVEQSVPQPDLTHPAALKMSSKSSDNLLAPHSNFLGIKRSDLGSTNKISAERVSLSASCGGEDTSSSIASDVGSVAPGPVLGRRAQREKALSSYSDTNSHHCDSEYDLSDSDLAPSQTDPGSLESSFISKSSLNSIEAALPLRISTAGANHLFHFVQLDRTEGILLSRPNLAGSGSSHKLSLVIKNFTKCIYSLQRIFENSIKFKRMNGLEVKGATMNNSLIAIKEQGILFECPIDDSDVEKKTVLTYWVVGRLFFLPHPREIYVCYEESTPQNMVEIAFRIALVSTS